MELAGIHACFRNPFNINDLVIDISYLVYETVYKIGKRGKRDALRLLN